MRSVEHSILLAKTRLLSIMFCKGPETTKVMMRALIRDLPTPEKRAGSIRETVQRAWWDTIALVPRRTVVNIDIIKCCHLTSVSNSMKK